MSEPILVPGETCLAIEHADRFRLIVDAEEYFRTLKRVMLQAKKQILLIGWDFDVRVAFEPRREKRIEGPNRLGSFLRWLSETRPELEIYILKWDLGLIYTMGHGALAMMRMRWKSNARIHFRFDGHHPTAAAHHQKIAVVDDRIAFCGGIDITDERWDTREHRDKDPRRRHPNGTRYDPWHDATGAVDGDAARRLGEIGRMRWLAATGEELAPPQVDANHWPDELEPTIRDVGVAIARTAPEMDDQDEVREIEALYLAGIRKTERVLYMESQYFASRKIAEAVAARLSEPNPPEIVIVNPESQAGFLEEVTMGAARAKLLDVVHAADRKKRFRFYYPQTVGGKPIYVHAKIMVVDDRLLRVGSSNLNNRSMGFDTECDVAIEAVGGQPRTAEISATIRAVRDDLIAEHLGVAVEAVHAACEAAGGSLIGALDALTTTNKRLKRFSPDDIGVMGELLAENDLVDPERPPHPWRGLRRRMLRPWRGVR